MHGAYTLKRTKCPWSVTSTRPSESSAASRSGLSLRSPTKVPGEPKNAASPSDVVDAKVLTPDSDRTKVATPEYDTLRGSLQWLKNPWYPCARANSCSTAGGRRRHGETDHEPGKLRRTTD